MAVRYFYAYPSMKWNCRSSVEMRIDLPLMTDKRGGQPELKRPEDRMRSC